MIKKEEGKINEFFFFMCWK